MSEFMEDWFPGIFVAGICIAIVAGIIWIVGKDAPKKVCHKYNTYTTTVNETDRGNTTTSTTTTEYCSQLEWIWPK